MKSSTPLRKVLIIEDEPSMRNAFSTLLTGVGCEGDIAYSDQQALNMIRREKFDAVLLDLRCPNLRAEEVVPQIQSIRPTLVGRVLVITGEVVDKKTMDLIEHYFLLRVLGDSPLQELAAKLRALLSLAPSPRNAT